MPYQIPDVFVTLEFPDVVPTIEIPTLTPVMVGEHYTVVKEFYQMETDGTETADDDIVYATLPPASSNDSLTNMAITPTGEFAPTAYVITEDGTTVDVTGMITFLSEDFSFTTNPPAGSLFISYRYLNDRYTGVGQVLLQASSTQDLIDLFGADSLGPANPLGYAMFCALTHGGVSVAGCAVGPAASDYDIDFNRQIGYATAFDFLKTQDVHSITLLTQDALIMNAALAHVNVMSGELGRSERRLFFAPSIGTDIVVRGGNSFSTWYSFDAHPDADGNDDREALALLADGGTYDLNGIPVLKIGTDMYYAKETFDDFTYLIDWVVRPGDALIELTSSAVAPASTRLKVGDKFSPVSLGGVELDILGVGIAGRDNFISVDNDGDDKLVSGSYQVVRPVNFATNRNQWVNTYKAFPRGYADERLTLVGPDTVYDPASGMDVPSYYAAAKLAGEISRVGTVPAGASPGVNGLGFTDSKSVPFRSSRYFTENELREIGGSGWTLLVNTSVDRPVNTQHTVTTNMSSPEFYELILGVERDFASRFFRNELREDLRRFRIDETTLKTIAMKCASIAAALKKRNSSARSFREVTVVSVAQNPLQLDQVLIELEMTHLYPLNSIKVNIKIVA